MRKIRMLLAQVAPPSQFDQMTPPLGLLYLAAYLRERFPLEICVIPQGLEKYSTDTLARRIIAYQPDIVGIRSLTPSSHALPTLIEAIRKSCSRVLIVIGGPHVAACGRAALKQSKADLAVSGEGEIPMEQILEAWQYGGSYDSIPGLLRKVDGGEVIQNPGAPALIQDLDTLPLPAYDLIDISRYWKRVSMPPIPQRRYISLFSSRGCPYGCAYCHNVFGKKFRTHSPERIAEEIRHYVKHYGVDEIEFVDDCFNLSKKRVLEYSELLQEKVGPVKTAFPNAIRADLLDEDTTDALVSAGMYYTSLALESGSPRIQKIIGKCLNIPKYLNAVEMCAEKGVFTNGFVMLGFPTETEEEIELTINTATESKLHIASFFNVTPFPNTDIYKWAMAHAPEKLKTSEFCDMEYWSVKINLTNIPDKKFFAYQRKAFRKFYLNPRRIYRISRDYPTPLMLPTYIPMFAKRMLKGIL